MLLETAEGVVPIRSAPALNDPASEQLMDHLKG